MLASTLRTHFRRARTQLRRAEQNGNAYFALSGALTATYCYFEARDHHVMTVRNEIASVQVEISSLRRRQAEDAAKPVVFSERPELFLARVTRQIAAASFDGPAALKHVQQDEVVGVLEADVGPHKGTYYLCRGERSEGLYPKHALEQIR